MARLTSERIWDYLSEHERKIIGLGIFSFLSLISFQHRHGEFHFYLYEFPSLVFLFALLASISVVTLIQIQRAKIRKLSDQIRHNDSAPASVVQEKIQKLTRRQQEVVELILQGKSNTEIQSMLHIEMSTLKTHINQIYKELGIQNRRELL